MLDRLIRDNHFNSTVRESNSNNKYFIRIFIRVLDQKNFNVLLQGG